MRVFVASWFFPPATSSEGIVTYKLLRNSRYSFDVCCAASDLWGYKHELPLVAPNVNAIPVETDDLQEWVDAAIAHFEQLHAQQPYDVIMTRSMPPESIRVGQAIKQAHPDVVWIASLADPIARNPYQLKDLVVENEHYDAKQKWDLLTATINGFGSIVDTDATVRYLRGMKEMEDAAVNQADALIFPCDTLMDYVLGSRKRKRTFSLPHTFDTELFAQAQAAAPTQGAPTWPDDGRVHIAFLGHTDNLRSLDPVARALHLLQKTNRALLDRLRIHCVGHITSETRNLVMNYQLQDVLVASNSVDYLSSLSVMQQSDWLLHVDASFEDLSDTGGSVFLAGKIADYLGTDHPVLGITGTGSPAHQVIQRAGGVCVDASDTTALAQTLADIAEGRICPSIDRAYRDTFDARKVAAEFDDMLDALVAPEEPFDREIWPTVANPNEEAQGSGKLISICIPSYNVECYLDRCLFSIVSCACANSLEAIVVNDGSKDATIDIARAYEQHYPGIVRVIDKPNGGHGSTINAALAIATGTYFRVLDSDDWVDSQSLDELVGNIQKRKVKADLVSSNYYQVYYDDGHTVAWEKQGDSEYYRTYSFAGADFSMEYFTMASAMWKTALLRRADFQLQEHTFYVDVEYLLYPIPYTYTVMFAPEYVYRYAVGSADQSINPATFTTRYDHHDRVIRRMLDYYKQHEPTLSDGQDAYMRSLFLRHLLQSHYLLSLIWDPDRTRGLARAADFDAFLAQLDNGLWQECALRYPAIKTARHYGFDPERMPALAAMDDDGTGLRARAKQIEDRLKQTRVADALFENDTVRNAYRKVLGRG